MIYPKSRVKQKKEEKREETVSLNTILFTRMNQKKQNKKKDQVLHIKPTRNQNSFCLTVYSFTIDNNKTDLYFSMKQYEKTISDNYEKEKNKNANLKQQLKQLQIRLKQAQKMLQMQKLNRAVIKNQFGQHVTDSRKIIIGNNQQNYDFKVFLFYVENNLKNPEFIKEQRIQKIIERCKKLSQKCSKVLQTNQCYLKTSNFNSLSQPIEQLSQKFIQNINIISQYSQLRLSNAYLRKALEERSVQTSSQIVSVDKQKQLLRFQISRLYQQNQQLRNRLKNPTNDKTTVQQLIECNKKIQTLQDQLYKCKMQKQFLAQQNYSQKDHIKQSTNEDVVNKNKQLEGQVLVLVKKIQQRDKQINDKIKSKIIPLQKLIAEKDKEIIKYSEQIRNLQTQNKDQLSFKVISQRQIYFNLLKKIAGDPSFLLNKSIIEDLKQMDIEVKFGNYGKISELLSKVLDLWKISNQKNQIQEQLKQYIKSRSAAMRGMQTISQAVNQDGSSMNRSFEQNFTDSQQQL